MRTLAPPLAAALLLLPACAAPRRAPVHAEGPPLSAAPVVLAEKEADSTGFSNGLWRMGPLYVSGQPTRDALERMADEGVATVINMRTDAEMKRDVKFDEARAVERLGMAYVELPLGGKDHPASPATVDAFAEAIGSARGKTLLHCASGGRCAELWAAYLVRQKGYTPDEAIKHARAMALQPSGFEKMAEVEPTYRPKPKE